MRRNVRHETIRIHSLHLGLLCALPRPVPPPAAAPCAPRAGPCPAFCPGEFLRCAMGEALPPPFDTVVPAERADLRDGCAMTDEDRAIMAPNFNGAKTTGLSA